MSKGKGFNEGYVQGLRDALQIVDTLSKKRASSLAPYSRSIVMMMRLEAMIEDANKQKELDNV